MTALAFFVMGMAGVAVGFIACEWLDPTGSQAEAKRLAGLLDVVSGQLSSLQSEQCRDNVKWAGLTRELREKLSAVSEERDERRGAQEELQNLLSHGEKEQALLQGFVVKGNDQLNKLCHELEEERSVYVFRETMLRVAGDNAWAELQAIKKHVAERDEDNRVLRQSIEQITAERDFAGTQLKKLRDRFIQIINDAGNAVLEEAIEDAKAFNQENSDV